MQKFLRGVCLALTAALLLSACAQEDVQSYPMPPPESSAAATEQPSETDTLEEGVCALRSYNPAQVRLDWKNSPKNQSFAVTYELLESIAEVLMQSEAAAVPEKLPRNLSERDWVRVQLDKKENQNIKWTHAYIRLLSDEPKNLDNAGKMLVEFESGTGDQAVFAFDESAFWEITDLLTASAFLYLPLIDGDAVEMQTSVFKQAEYSYLGDCLQFGNLLLCGWNFANDGMPDSTFEAINANTGKSLYQFTLPEYPGRVEKTSIQDYDYRLVLSDRIVYRKSADASAEQTWMLPETVKSQLITDIGDDESAFDADPQVNLLTYAAQDGIWLANADGGGAKLVLDRKDLADVVEKIDLPKDLTAQAAYVHPLLMNGGKQVAATIVYWTNGNEEPASYGISIYDVAGKKVTTIPDIFSWLAYPAYALDEKTAGAIGGEGMQLVNVETGTYRTVDFNFHEEDSFDFQTFFRTERGRDEQGRPKWTLLARRGKEEIPSLLIAFCDGFSVRAVTPDYLVCIYRSNSDGGNRHFCIVP